MPSRRRDILIICALLFAMAATVSLGRLGLWQLVGGCIGSIVVGFIAGWLGIGVASSAIFVGIVSVILLACAALQWVFIDRFTPLGAAIALLPLGMLALAALGLSIAVASFHWNRYRWRAIWPLATEIISIALCVTVPWTNLYIDAVWQFRRAGFQQAVEQIKARDNPQSGYVLLDPAFRHLSADEGKVYVHRSADTLTILFFTYSGILDHFSGFTYVDPDAAPTAAAVGANDVQVTRKSAHWYFVAK